MTRVLEFPGEARSRPGCGFLDTGELEVLLAGELGRERDHAFRRHRADGCAPCALLAADADAFRQAMREGALAGERREFETGRSAVETELRRAVRDGATIGGLAQRWRLLGLAAAALLAAGVLLPLLREGRPADVIVLPDGGRYTIEAMPYSTPPVVRSAENLIELWTAAGVALEAGRHAEAEALFARIAELDPENHDALLYRGQSLLLSGQPREALRLLGEARRLATEQAISPAADDWYYGLAALAVDDVSGAAVALRRAASADGPFAARAAELLQRLEADTD